MLAGTQQVLTESAGRLEWHEVHAGDYVADLAPREFLHEVSERVRRVVPHDASGWTTLDPDTLLPSGTLETEKSPELVRALCATSYWFPTSTTRTAVLGAQPSPRRHDGG